MAKKKLPPWFDPEQRTAPVFYHLTPFETWKKKISKEGLVPRLEKRGIAVDDPSQKRIYLFQDPDTADDALTNWFAEERYPDVRFFALLEVAIPPTVGEVHDDPEIGGSYFVTEPIPPSHVRLVQKVDAGEPE